MSLNRDLVCLLCNEPVLAKYLCRNHYHQDYRKKRAKAVLEGRLTRKRVTRAERAKNLEETGAPCLVAACGRKTLQASGLCQPHDSRAQVWGFSVEELVRIYDRGECEICRTVDNLVLDHDHDKGCSHRKSSGCSTCFRGLLCNGCNTAIGLMGEDSERLKRAATYVLKDND